MADRPKRKVEFIESYWTGGEIGGDYQWDDNHGELVRCIDCAHYDEYGYCNMQWATQSGNWYCADGVRKIKQESEAKWIYGEDKTGVDGWHCSECNFFEPWFYEFTDDIDFIRFYAHCPRCGRKMTSYTGKPTQYGR